MMSVFKNAGAAMVPLAAFLGGGTPAAEAKIVCKEGYQVVQGSALATPYCQDNLVAAVARANGINVSDAEIRNNPNLKRHVCSLVGRDIRIYQACIDSFSGRRGF